MASFLAGYIGEYLGYQYMYFLSGVLALILLILDLIKLPYKKFPKNKKAKIDYLGSL